MIWLKKLLFALPFLFFFLSFLWQLNLFLEDPGLILSLEVDVFWRMVMMLGFLTASAVSFTLFATLASNWLAVMIVAAASSVISVLFIPMPNGLILTAGLIMVFLSVYFLLHRKLKVYLTFQPTLLLIPSIKYLVTLTLLVSSLVFYLAESNLIQKEGFKLPPSLMNSIIKMVPKPDIPEATNSLAVQLTPEEIQQLKQNPALLKRFNLTEAQLDKIIKASQDPKSSVTATEELVKSAAENQIQSYIKPNLHLIPIVLAALFFITLQSLASLFNILLTPLVWFIFLILEKTGFTRYEVEMREVKKLIV